MNEKNTILRILNSGCFEILFMDKIPYLSTGTSILYGSNECAFIGSAGTTVCNNIKPETRDKIVMAIREILTNEN